MSFFESPGWRGHAYCVAWGGTLFVSGYLVYKWPMKLYDYRSEGLLDISWIGVVASLVGQLAVVVLADSPRARLRRFVWGLTLGAVLSTIGTFP